MITKTAYDRLLADVLDDLAGFSGMLRRARPEMSDAMGDDSVSDMNNLTELARVMVRLRNNEWDDVQRTFAAWQCSAAEDVTLTPRQASLLDRHQIRLGNPIESYGIEVPESFLTYFPDPMGE